MEDAILRLNQEAELEQLHGTIVVHHTSGTAVTTDFPACKTIAMRELAIGSARDCRCIAIRDNLAYVGIANGGVAAVDISDPANATVVGGIQIPGCEPTSIALDPATNMLYVSDRLAGMHACDLTNPRRPAHTASHPAKFHTQRSRVLVEGNRLVLVDDHAFVVFDRTNPRQPVPVALHHRMRTAVGFFRGAALVDQHLYLTQGMLGLWTFDLSVPSRPRALVGQAVVLDSRPTDKLIADALAYWQGRLFVCSSSGVWVARTRRDGPPESEAFFTGPGYIRETAQGEGRDDHLLLGVFEPYDHAQYVFDLAAGPRYLGRQRLTRAVERIWGFQRHADCTLSVAGMQGLLVTMP